jgi:hypothetical protein
VTVSCQQPQAECVGGKCNATHRNHCHTDWLAADEEPAAPFDQNADAKSDLQHPTGGRGGSLHSGDSTDRVQTDCVDAGVGEHLERIATLEVVPSTPPPQTDQPRNSSTNLPILKPQNYLL